MIQNINDYKKSLENEVEKIINLLKKEDQDEDFLKDEKLRESYTIIKSIITQSISKMNTLLYYFRKNAEWDRFNIAFFGETNAGKSTLLESLLEGNGKSIGEGYKDHTKKLNRQNYKNITFLDMPGIEGNEALYTKEIQRAVEKAHVVFYVMEPKEPEEGTLRKIRKYLKDRTKVISVINCRGKASLYQLTNEKDLVNSSTSLIAKNAINKFQNTIGSHYFSNIIVNAYIGFLSRGKPSKKEFIEDQRNTKLVFGNYNNAYKFSRIEEVKKAINDLTLSSKEEIAVSNTYKLLKNLEYILSGILKEKKNFDALVKDVSVQADNMYSTSCSIISKYEDKLILKTESIIDDLNNNLISVVYDGIDKKWTESYFKQKINTTKKEFEDKITNEVKAELNKLQSELDELLKEFKKRLSLAFEFSSFKSEINLKFILEKLEISLEYIFSQILDIGLTIYSIILAFAIHPIAGIAVAILAGLRKIWDWFFGDPDKRKIEAKSKAYDNLTNFTTRLKRKTLRDTKTGLRRIKINFKIVKKTLDNYLLKTRSISILLNEDIATLFKMKSDISKLLSTFILSEEINISYIDLELNKMLIVGTEKIELQNVFRMKDIYKFDSIDTMLDSFKVNFKNNELNLSTNDEFVFRALNANKHILNFERIRRPF
ncbi:MAG: 50S ribosome-binding GTPase [Ignavibacteria bacterium]|nr:50S ribosome-binding GTPase [Ignavibacteria bacterium]